MRAGPPPRRTRAEGPAGRTAARPVGTAGKAGKAEMIGGGQRWSTGYQSWAMQRPRSQASQPIQPGVFTVSVSSL